MLPPHTIRMNHDEEKSGAHDFCMMRLSMLRPMYLPRSLILTISGIFPLLDHIFNRWIVLRPWLAQCCSTFSEARLFVAAQSPRGDSVWHYKVAWSTMATELAQKNRWPCWLLYPIQLVPQITIWESGKLDNWKTLCLRKQMPSILLSVSAKTFLRLAMGQLPTRITRKQIIYEFPHGGKLVDYGLLLSRPAQLWTFICLSSSFLLRFSFQLPRSPPSVSK